MRIAVGLLFLFGWFVHNLASDAGAPSNTQPVIKYDPLRRLRWQCAVDKFKRDYSGTFRELKKKEAVAWDSILYQARLNKLRVLSFECSIIRQDYTATWILQSECFHEICRDFYICCWLSQIVSDTTQDYTRLHQHYDHNQKTSDSAVSPEQDGLESDGVSSHDL